MIYLSAAVVLVGMLAVLNVVLTVGVIRRLREHTEKLANVPGGQATIETMKAVGEQVGEFATITTDGLPVSRSSLAGQTMVGFFTAHCPPCLDMAPKFVEQARAVAGSRDRTLAVVVGSGEDATAFAASFTDAVRVVTEPDAPDLGPVVTAFAVNAFPSFCLVDDQGVIIATGNSPHELPVPVAA